MNLQLDWQQGAVLAVGLTAAQGAAVRSQRASRAAAYLKEAGIIAALYALWQLAGSVALMGTADAYGRGRWIERFQRRLGLPSERWAQQAVLGHPWLVQLCNLYYAAMHFAVLGVFLTWLFVRHRAAYPLVRNVLVVLTAASLVIQFVPVAPPRLLPELGFVDVAANYGQSVYRLSGITIDELAAMPSVHVGWALLIACGVVRYSTSRHRWWIVLHPAITVFVVAATANHFWLDGIVAAVLLGLSWQAVQCCTALRHRTPDGDRLATRPDRDLTASTCS
ncbi:MAG: hypothetical protein QOK10_2895 [Pseudonocardiales bacterium]|jgi:hypothetical protein|nr:hypothetical protein [Pseudonocardiales bacterium]